MNKTELILQAHNALHQGRVHDAHEFLHAAMGIDNSAPPAHAPLAHTVPFDNAFQQLCRDHAIRACYVMADITRDDGKTRILIGGEATMCQHVGARLRP